MTSSETGWAHRVSVSEDIDAIWGNLADRLRQEFEIAEQRFPWLNIRANATDLVRQRQSRTFVKSGRPTIAMCWQPVAHGFATTFLAIEDYFDGRISNVRYSRRAIAEFQADLGNSKLIANSFGQHPAIGSWFKAMGYEEQPSDTDYRVFIRWPRQTEACPCLAPFSIPIG